MRFERRLEYCGECGNKLKDIKVGQKSNIKVRYCKKCKYYMPEDARYWIAFSHPHSKEKEK